MTHDDIIEFAKQAGFVIDEASQKFQPNCIEATHLMIDQKLMRFAEIVAAAEREKSVDLLAALTTVVPILCRMYGPQADNLPPVRMIRAAIAKAEAR